MFAWAYFPERYYPPRYFAEFGAAPSGAGGGYFAARYFANRHYPARYFPHVAEETPPPPTPTTVGAARGPARPWPRVAEESPQVWVCEVSPLPSPNFAFECDVYFIPATTAKPTKRQREEDALLLAGAI